MNKQKAKRSTVPNVKRRLAERYLPESKPATASVFFTSPQKISKATPRYNCVDLPEGLHWCAKI